MSRVIIAGGRDFNDYKRLNKILDRVLKTALHRFNEGVDQLEIAEGGALGADMGGRLYAIAEGIPFKTFEADWNTHGKSAGYIRNKKMANYSDALVAFWDGRSKGTKMMIDLAYEYGLEVRIIKY